MTGPPNENAPVAAGARRKSWGSEVASRIVPLPSFRAIPAIPRLGILQLRVPRSIAATRKALVGILETDARLKDQLATQSAPQFIDLYRQEASFRRDLAGWVTREFGGES